MTKAKLLITNTVLFLVCCSMSKCFNEPGPVTTIHGFVYDAVTGNPLGNVALQAVSQFGSHDQSGNLVTTAADGSFYLKFTPQNSETFYLRPALSQLRRYYFTGTTPVIVLGKDNVFNLQALRMVLLNIHLVNNSNQSRSNYDLDVTELNPKIISSGAFFDLAPPKADTTFITYLPQLESYSCKSDFSNGLSSSGLVDTLNFYKTITLGVNDTTVVITNP